MWTHNIFIKTSCLPKIVLECYTTGLDPLDCKGQTWQQFDLVPYVVTTYVRVTISIVCTAENNGFREIRVFSLKGKIVKWKFGDIRYPYMENENTNAGFIL